LELLALLLEGMTLPSAPDAGAHRLLATGLCLAVIGFGLYMVPATFG
jgi:hypothetical protein